jgi:hypothetical protein
MIVKRQLTEYEYAQKIERKYDNAIEHDKKNFDRAMELWKLYWGVDTDKGQGQIDADVVAEMIRLGKQPGAYNLCRPAVDNIAGGIMSSPFGFDLSPVDSEATSLTYIAKDIQYSEQEIMNWRLHRLEMVIGGLICRSDTEVYVDKKKYGKPYIGRRTRLPGTVTYDPNWKSPVSGDCRECYVEEMLSPLQMLEIYAGKETEIVKAAMFKAFGEKAIEELAKIQWEQGEEYGFNSGIIPYANRDDIWGSLYKVIQFYHMEKITREFEYVLTEDEEKIRIPAELKNPQEKIEWLNQNYPGWIPDSIFKDTEELDIQYMTAICPALAPGLLLCNGPTDVQCGRLQFFPWSAYRANGEWGGIMDAIRDLQRSVNWIQNTLQYRLHVDGDGCSWYVDESGFDSPQEFERWKQSKNKSGETFKLAPNYLLKNPNGPAVPVRASPYPKEAMDRLTHLIEVMLPKLSKVNPAAQGRSESAGEAASLYKMKKLQNDVEQFTIYEGLRNFENEFGEAYLNLLIHVHGEELNRKWYNPRTKKSFIVNKTETRNLEDGTKVDVIVNNIAKLRDIRHRVIITESDESPTRKVEVMQTAAEMLKAIDPNRKPITYQRQAYNLTSNTDTFSDDEKKEMEADHEMELETARDQLRMQDLQFKAQGLQFQLQLEQLEGQVEVLKAQKAQRAGGGGMQQPMNPTGEVGQPASPASTSPEGSEQQRGWAQPISQPISNREMENAY